MKNPEKQEISENHPLTNNILKNPEKQEISEKPSPHFHMSNTDCTYFV
jgi:hypothetical protein